MSYNYQVFFFCLVHLKLSNKRINAKESTLIAHDSGSKSDICHTPFVFSFKLHTYMFSCRYLFNIVSIDILTAFLNHTKKIIL